MNTILTFKHNGHLNKYEIQGEHNHAELIQWCADQNYTYLRHVINNHNNEYRTENGLKVKLIK